VFAVGYHKRFQDLAFDERLAIKLMGKSPMIHDLRADTKKLAQEVWALVPIRAAQILQ
jgi:hypothetical protein